MLHGSFPETVQDFRNDGYCVCRWQDPGPRGLSLSGILVQFVDQGAEEPPDWGYHGDSVQPREFKEKF